MSRSFSFDDCLCNWDDNERFGELDSLLRKRKTVQFTLEIVLTEGRTHPVVISSISAKATAKSFIISFTSIDGQEHQLIQRAPTEVSN